MFSLDMVTALCRTIGQDLDNQDLSRYELIDRATALTLLSRSLDQLVEEEHAVEGHCMGAAGGQERVAREIQTVRTELHTVRDTVQVMSRDELRDFLIAAQLRLFAVCRLLT